MAKSNTFSLWDLSLSQVVQVLLILANLSHDHQPDPMGWKLCSNNTLCFVMLRNTMCCCELPGCCCTWQAMRHMWQWFLELWHPQ